jgi:hypothetical protein
VNDSVVAVFLVVIGSMTTLNFLFSLSFARRLREHGPSQGPATNLEDMLPRAGRRVRPFEATALDGSSVSLEDVEHGSTVVLFVSTTCPACERLRKRLGSDRFSEQTLVFVHGPGESTVPEFAYSFEEIATQVAWLGDDVSVQDAFDVGAFPALVRVIDGIVTEAAIDLRKFTARAEPPLRLALTAEHRA